MRRPFRPARQGFTLIELMVVLAIASVVTAITVGGFRSIGESNRRTSCQSNLSQLYQACRQYGQDYSGRFPYYNPYDSANPARGGVPATTWAVGGIGLWALYTYPADTDRNSNGIRDDLPQFRYDNTPINKPLSSYVRSPKLFHCPADNYLRSGGSGVESGQLSLSDVNGVRDLNPDYISYQLTDEGAAPTYSTFRVSGNKKQLLYYSGTTVEPARPPDDKTVVAWCRFHRSLSTDGSSSYPGRRNFDNVLFFDGSVQLLPQMQSTVDFSPCYTLSATCVGTWERIPRTP